MAASTFLVDGSTTHATSPYATGELARLLAVRNTLSWLTDRRFFRDYELIHGPENKKEPGISQALKLIRISSRRSGTQPNYWKDLPQPQDLVAFGFSNVKPCRSKLLCHPMTAPSNNSALFLSTTTATPCWS